MAELNRVLEGSLWTSRGKIDRRETGEPLQ